MITRKSLQILENRLVIARNCNRQYDKSFAEKGAKIGSTLRIRLPNRYLVSNGPALVVQDENEQDTTLSVSSQKHIGINFTTAELALSMDDFSERFLEPAISQLAASIDNDVANAFSAIGQSVGTPGTTPASALVLLQAHQKIDEAAGPRQERYGTVNPAANASLVDGLKGLFNPTDTLSKQFKEGLMGERVLGFEEFSMSQSIQQFTTGSRTAGATVTTTSKNGDTSIAITTNGATDTIKKGDVFTIAGTNKVNPQTRQSTGSLFQFVATADATASGSAATVKVAAIYDNTSALATVDTLPAATSAVTWLGAASTTYPQNLIYHKNAIALATADLEMPQGVDMAARANHNGISLRIVRQYDINNDRMPCRVDVLYGYGVIRPELACRLWG